MQHIQDLTHWKTLRGTYRPNQSIGFVPTMGALHPGHASLITASQAENDITVVSIFVNPTQFNQPHDFIQYPRTLDADLDLLRSLHVDVCLLPEPDDIYPDNNTFQILENTLSQNREGQYRPGHFTGVLTVVMKLLNIVRPTHAYFGEKDYQQFQLIHNMVNAFFMDIDIQARPTIREPSRLPYSSRNQRLSPEERKLADQFAYIFHQSIPMDNIISALQALGITVEYVEEHFGRRFAAVRIGKIRLIDNYSLTDSTEGS